MGKFDGFDFDEFDPDLNEPIGSCADCGCNLYEDDDEESCDQCLWYRSQGATRNNEEYE